MLQPWRGDDWVQPTLATLTHEFDFTDPVRFSDHRKERGEQYHRQACRRGWKGLRADKQPQDVVGEG